MSGSQGSLVLLRDDNKPDIEVRSESAGSNKKKEANGRTKPARSASIALTRSGSSGSINISAASSAPNPPKAPMKRKVHIKVKKPAAPPARPVAYKAVPVKNVRPAYVKPVYPEPNEEEYEELMNPEKRRAPPEGSEVEEEVEMSERYEEASPRAPQGEQQEDVKPSDGYKSIDDEKHDLLLKLFRLKEKGYPVRGFTLSSDILEMRTDYAKASYSEDMKSGLEMCRETLITLTNGLEGLNRRFDPFDLHLDGFAAHTYAQRARYDNVFEKLIAKYRSSVSAPPELLFLWIFGSSAFTFHMAHRQANQFGPDVAAAIKRRPDILSRVMNEIEKEELHGAYPPPPQHQVYDPPPRQQQAAPQRPGGPPPPVSARREMRGPAFDMSMLAGMMPFGASVRQTQQGQGNPPPTFAQGPPVYDPRPPQQGDAHSVPTSSESSGSGSQDTREIVVEEPKKRGRKPRALGKVVQIGA